MSPTARSMALLRARGYIVGRLEHFDLRLCIRTDLWGCDLLAVHPRERAFLLVQCTSLANISHRRAKLRAIPAIRKWLQAGGRVQIHGWVKRQGRWQPKIEELSADSLATEVVHALPRRRRRPRQPDLFAGFVEER